jgi:hypothetical protein
MRNRTADEFCIEDDAVLWPGNGGNSAAQPHPSEMRPYTPYVNYTDRQSTFPTILRSSTASGRNTTIGGRILRLSELLKHQRRCAEPATHPINSELTLPSAILSQDYGTAAVWLRKRSSSISTCFASLINPLRCSDQGIQCGISTALLGFIEYRNKARPWDSYNIDRMFMAGIPLKITAHTGQNHEVPFDPVRAEYDHLGRLTGPAIFNYQQNTNTSPRSCSSNGSESAERRWDSNTEYKAVSPRPARPRATRQLSELATSNTARPYRSREVRGVSSMTSTSALPRILR